MQYNLNIKQSYNFLMRAPGILGYRYDNSTVLGIMDFSSAKLVDDIVAIHAQVYPDLPSGVPRSAEDLIYVKIKTVEGTIKVLAMDWIAYQPVIVTTTNINVAISNVTIDSISQIRDILAMNGFPDISISTV